ncbi:hypothetical protein EXVG_00273 [Emiliania huxleyi virus 202]|nr:hypothetical protein EXVG_00273 [Emiliania huxleyi virus 202]AHA54108.1 putative membrane protein [Emiliania huxleyi virus 18]
MYLEELDSLTIAISCVSFIFFIVSFYSIFLIDRLEELAVFQNIMGFIQAGISTVILGLSYPIITYELSEVIYVVLIFEVFPIASLVARMFDKYPRSLQVVFNIFASIFTTSISFGFSAIIIHWNKKNPDVMYYYPVVAPIMFSYKCMNAYIATYASYIGPSTQPCYWEFRRRQRSARETRQREEQERERINAEENPGDNENSTEMVTLDMVV